MAEVWKPIAGYEDLYEVSSAGQIRSLDRLIDRTSSRQGSYTLKGRILKTRADSDGYMLVDLNSGGNPCTFKVHRLVAEAFIPNPSNLPQVDHRDGRRFNNHKENLKWSTVRSNLLGRRSVRVNSSGYRGVRKRKGKFVAYANDPKSKSYKHLGTFDNVDAALTARKVFMEVQNGGSR